MADHVFGHAMVERLVAEPLGEGEVILAIDSRLGRNGAIDPAEATKVSVRDGRIVAIGKHLEEASAYDTGIFVLARHLRWRRGEHAGG